MAGQATAARSGYRDRNSTADRALDVLLLFHPGKLVWTGSEIADQLGVARSTGYRYLQSLLASGFLEECDGGFRLGPRVFELSRLARRSLGGLPEIARPVMRDLADRVQETVILTRRSGASVVCLELEETTRSARLSYERGHILPINAGASAQILLAWSSEAEVRALLEHTPLHRFTARTVVDADALITRLAAIRAAGVAVSRGELDDDVLGVAAPIWSDGGQLRAALSVAALSSRVPDDQLDSVKQAVAGAAAIISARLQLIES